MTASLNQKSSSKTVNDQRRQMVNDPEAVELLRNILVQLQIMNTHLGMGSDTMIHEDDVPNLEEF